MVNKVILIGNLGRDPELRHTQDGTAVANLSLATTEKWKDRNSGEQQERTEWHRLNVWGKQAEIAAEYLTKGRQIYVEGALQTRKWEKDGVERYTTEIKVLRFQMLGKKGDGGGSSEAPKQEEESGRPAPDADDIPF